MGLKAGEQVFVNGKLVTVERQGNDPVETWLVRDGTGMLAAFPQTELTNETDPLPPLDPVADSIADVKALANLALSDAQVANQRGTRASYVLDSAGPFTLTTGTQTVSDPAIKATSIVTFTFTDFGSAALTKRLKFGTIIEGTSFVITSQGGTDDAQGFYLIFNPR